jgi:hypothetical protein
VLGFRFRVVPFVFWALSALTVLICAGWVRAQRYRRLFIAWAQPDFRSLVCRFSWWATEDRLSIVSSHPVRSGRCRTCHRLRLSTALAHVICSALTRHLWARHSPVRLWTSFLRSDVGLIVVLARNGLERFDANLVWVLVRHWSYHLISTLWFYFSGLLKYQAGLLPEAVGWRHGVCG